MKHITMIDTTLCREDSTYSFKEKIEMARQLERLNVDVIELPEIKNSKTDRLFVKTVSPFVKNSVLSVAAGSTMQSIDDAADSLAGAVRGRIRIELPVSPVSMEYVCHKKAPKMITWVADCVTKAKSLCDDVEFCAVDATRAEPEFLMDVITSAVTAGATAVTVCDTAAEWLPSDFAAFVKKVCDMVSVPVYVSCNDKNGMACAASVSAVQSGAVGVKIAVGGTVTSLETFATVLKNCGDRYGLTSAIRQTELHRTVKQLCWIADNAKNAHNVVSSTLVDDGAMQLDVKDTKADVIAAVSKLGYDLSDDDAAHVYEEFLRVAAKKTVGAKELEAIVASSALQVPATYKLISYVVNNSNVMSTSAQITLEKDGQTIQEVCIGDGPMDAAFRAIDRLIGYHYELDDFQIQSVTEGKEAMGSALVKLRADGKLYAGNGISTDIIGAGIRAYLNAVNKIVYEEV